MSDILALRNELAAIDLEASELDEYILGLLSDNRASVHAAAVVAAVSRASLNGPQADSTSPALTKELFDALGDRTRFSAIATKADVMAEQIEESRTLSEVKGIQRTP